MDTLDPDAHSDVRQRAGRSPGFKITACAVVEHDDWTGWKVAPSVYGLRSPVQARDRTSAMVQWATGVQAAEVVVDGEPRACTWKSPFAALEAVGIVARVVNAHHVKAVPGSQDRHADAQWLATLARAGLAACVVHPAGGLGLRQLAKPGGAPAAKATWPTDVQRSEEPAAQGAGGRGTMLINVVVADGPRRLSARAMVKALIVGKPMHEVPDKKGLAACQPRRNSFEP